jgi:hypothetical protein
MSVTKSYVDSITSAASSNNVSLSHVPGATASPYLSTVGIVWSSSASLTLEETEELRQLEIELSLAKRNQRIAIFKKLPIDTRQDIVNQLLLDDAFSQMRTCSGDGFESNARLTHLKSRAAPSFGHSGITAGYATTPFGYHQSGTSAILEFLTKEEVINAHLEQSLEEQLLNSPTDSI